MGTLPQLTKHDIQTMALNHGFSLKVQANGQNDLNPYVYDFARALVEKALDDVFHPLPDKQGRFSHYLAGLSHSEPVSSLPGIHPNEKLIDFAKRMQHERDMAQKALVNALQILPQPSKSAHAPKALTAAVTESTQTQSVSDFLDILPIKDEFNLSAKSLEANPLLQWSLPGVYNVTKPQEHDPALQLRARAVMLLIDTMSEYYIAMNPAFMPMRAKSIVDRLFILRDLSVVVPTLYMPWYILTTTKALPDLHRLCKDGGLISSNTAFNTEIMSINTELPWIAVEKLLLNKISQWLLSVREHSQTRMSAMVFNDMLVKFLNGYLQHDIDSHRDTCRFSQAAVHEFIAHFKS